MQPNSPTPASPPAPAAALPTGNDVLVVEDEQRVRDMLARALKGMGFTATFAASAETGAKAMAQRPFDILILDLNLPGMGGIEFLESARKRNCDAPAIILTGFGDLESARKAIHLDVVEFLTKPCTLGNLEVALSRARQRRKAQIVSQTTVDPGPDPATPMRFAPPPPTSPTGETSAQSMQDVERRTILTALHKHNGNRAATAAELGISVRKLYYRIGEYQKQGHIPNTREA